MIELSQLVGVKWVATRLGISRRAVYKLKDSRSLPFYQVGRRVRFAPAEIEDWIKKRRIEEGS